MHDKRAIFRCDDEGVWAGLTPAERVGLPWAQVARVSAVHEHFVGEHVWFVRVESDDGDEHRLDAGAPGFRATCDALAERFGLPGDWFDRFRGDPSEEATAPSRECVG